MKEWLQCLFKVNAGSLELKPKEAWEDLSKVKQAARDEENPGCPGGCVSFSRRGSNAYFNIQTCQACGKQTKPRKRSWTNSALANVHICLGSSWIIQVDLKNVLSAMQDFKTNKDKESRQQQDWKQKDPMEQSLSCRLCLPKKRTFYPKRKHWPVWNILQDTWMVSRLRSSQASC